MAVIMNGDHRASGQARRDDDIRNDRKARAADVKATSCCPAARRFLLRLDDGSLICNRKCVDISPRDDGVVILGAEECQKMGRVMHEDLLRAYRALVGLHRKPGEEDVEAPSGSANPFGRPAKRPRAAGDELPASPTGTAVSGGGPLPPDWQEKCREILLDVMKQLGEAVHIFDKPVDPTAVVDYYKVVKTPMDLGTITEKLSAERYSRPAEFAADMRQVWYNCKIYNKKGDYVERSGSGASLHFESLWTKSGLAESKDRSRRANAGLAAAKFEPQASLASKKPSKSGTQGAPKKGKQGKATSKKPSRKVAAPPMTKDQMAALASRLSQLDEDALQGVVNIIRERMQITTGPDEEIELDIEALDNDTLWELDRYLQSATGAMPVASGAAWAMDSGSDSDSSTESDSD